MVFIGKKRIPSLQVRFWSHARWTDNYNTVRPTWVSELKTVFTILTKITTLLFYTGYPQKDIGILKMCKSARLSKEIGTYYYKTLPIRTPNLLLDKSADLSIVLCATRRTFQLRPSHSAKLAVRRLSRCLFHKTNEYLIWYSMTHIWFLRTSLEGQGEKKYR